MHRPIRVDENGIAAMAWGKPLKYIAWPDVKKIVRVRTQIVTFSDNVGYGYELRIISENEQIRLDEAIYRPRPRPLVRFPVFVKHLNEYIERYSIPLEAYDRGGDTINPILRNMKDHQERKKLLKEGIPVPIGSLL